MYYCYVLYCFSCGNCNAVAVWIDYHLDSTNVIHTGLLSNPEIGKNLDWDPYTRQAVHLFKNPIKIDDVENNRWRIKYKVVLKPSTGEFDFNFTIVKR